MASLKLTAVIGLIVLYGGISTVDNVFARHATPVEAGKSARLVSGLNPGGEYYNQCEDEITSGDSDESLFALSNEGIGACLTYTNKVVPELLPMAIESYFSLEVSAASVVSGVSMSATVDQGRCVAVIKRLAKACPATVRKAMG